jgi:hypothetical protein
MAVKVPERIRRARREYAAWVTEDRMTRHSPAAREGLARARAALAAAEGVSEVAIAQSRRCAWCGAPSRATECGDC